MLFTFILISHIEGSKHPYSHHNFIFLLNLGNLTAKYSFIIILSSSSDLNVLILVVL